MDQQQQNLGLFYDSPGFLVVLKAAGETFGCPRARFWVIAHELDGRQQEEAMLDNCAQVAMHARELALIKDTGGGNGK